jgi:hypothetical protein
MSMRTALAKQLVADGRLEAELARREERRWLAEDDTGLTALVGHLGRLLGELEQPMKAGQVECDDGPGFDGLVARLDELRDQLAALTAREEAEAAGIEHVVRTPVVRPQQEVERRPSSKATCAPSRVQPDVAAVPIVDLVGWKFGTVVRFDQIAQNGVASFIGSGGAEEVPIGFTAFRKSGLTNLFSGQYLKLSVASLRMEAIRANPGAVLADRPARVRYR